MLAVAAALTLLPLTLFFLFTLIRHHRELVEGDNKERIKIRTPTQERTLTRVNICTMETFFKSLA